MRAGWLLLVLPGCLGPWDPGVIVVEDDIEADTTWSADRIWVLPSDEIRYVDDARLTIEPGTTVLGEPGAALIVSRSGDLDARGTKAAPIVFTSAQPTGSRRPGDWGGLVLLGNAPIHTPMPRQIEGVEGDEPRARYGGTDASADCGALDYVRIEYAGYEVFDGNELNGLTLGGCGQNTYIRHLQVHLGLDDGIEIFGGSVDLKWVVLTGIGDDSLDWDEGWQGRAQFVVAQQFPVHPDPAVLKSGDEAFEGEGPLSLPVISNATLLGSNDPTSSQSALHLRDGTGGNLRNLLIGYQTARGVDVEDALTAELALSGDLVVANAMLFDVGAGGVAWTPDEDDNDGGFDEADWLAQAGNRFGDSGGLFAPEPPEEPGLVPSWVANPTLLWVPPAGSSAAQGAWAPPADEQEFFDSAPYVGAIRPGTVTPWWEGWVAFPYE